MISAEQGFARALGSSAERFSCPGRWFRSPASTRLFHCFSSFWTVQNTAGHAWNTGPRAKSRQCGRRGPTRLVPAGRTDACAGVSRTGMLWSSSIRPPACVAAARVRGGRLPRSDNARPRLHGHSAREVQDAKLATVSTHTTRVGGRVLVVRRLQITEAGRHAI